MARLAPSDVNGYVLAGGKSSRMGTDKALLELAGKPLALRAVEKLQRVCGDVCILGSRAELEVYAPLVPDLHEGCGPLGGMEAAFSHSTRSWNLFMAVDMPFLPVGFLDGWANRVIGCESARAALFTVDGMPQPALCLLHRGIAPFVGAAVGRGEFKLFPVLLEAAKTLAARQGMDVGAVLLNQPWSGVGAFDDVGAAWDSPAAQREARHLWFANLNTPEEFRAAEASAGLLEMD